jgi:hypothetical protein
MTGGIRVSACRYFPSLILPIRQEALRSAVDRVVESTENVDERAENTGSGLMDVCVRPPYA